LRELAPISDQGWLTLDAEAKQRLTQPLAARRVVDFSGPHGWQHSATNLGHVTAVADAPAEPAPGRGGARDGGVSGLLRKVAPLVELRSGFSLPLTALRDVDRGADDADLEPLDQAARRLAVAENLAVLHGWKGAVTGVSEACAHEPISLGKVPGGYPAAVAAAVALLMDSGIVGPYALAISGEHHKLVSETTEHGGYPLMEHLRRILDGPVVWTPGISGAVVLSQRGGDFILDCGQDISLGYDRHDADSVALYLQESLSFHVATPEAAVVLVA
ncbi:MAG: bacteriocin family protein, partial [Acidobacteriota bacterium]|nr:bacteriocin family protein [Acidobacteriota bacterium]